MLWKCCTQCASKFGKLSSGHRVEKVSFHSNPKERQCKRIYKLPHNYTHLISRQGFSSMWIENFQMFKLDLEKAEEPEIKLPPSVGASKKQESSRKISASALLTTPKPLTVDHSKLWKILQEMGIPDHLTYLLRYLYAGQEATVRTRHGTMDWFQIQKEACQGCILWTCLFNL